MLQYQTRLATLSKLVNAVDIRTYEARDADLDALAAQVGDILDSALAVLDEIVAGADASDESESLDSLEFDPGAMTPTSYLSFDRAVDGAVRREIRSTRAVGEIAFIAQLELQQRSQRLAWGRAQRRKLVVLAECDSALRRVLKAASAVDTAVARAFGGAPQQRFESELQSSLDVRTTYARFRRAVYGHQALPLLKRLRAVGTEIAVLIGRATYPRMRVRDRLLMRQLQSRILEWLRHYEGPRSERDGTRLWQDICGFVDMLMQISKRQELVEHDREVAARLRAELAASGGRLCPVSELSPLEGLDASVDDLLAGADAISAAQLVSLLDGLFGADDMTPPQALRFCS
ncbi:MAG: hypothetical protein KC503_04235 [Myxococcales bacterium]|nr:hypothetical protein [Myxococcales bacterium]